MKYCHDVLILNEQNEKTLFNHLKEFDNVFLFGPTQSGKTFFAKRYIEHQDDIVAYWDKENIVKMLWSDGFAKGDYFPVIEEFEDNLFRRYREEKNQILYETSGLISSPRSRARQKICCATRSDVMLFFMAPPEILKSNLTNNKNKEFYKDLNYLTNQLSSITFPKMTECKQYKKVYFVSYEHFGDIKMMKRYFSSGLMFM